MGNQLMSDARVRSSLNEILNEMYPTLDADVGKWTKNLLDMPISEEMTPETKLKVLHYIGKIRGHEQPSKSAVLRVNVDQSKIALPEE